MAITPKIVPDLYPSSNARLSLDEKVEVIIRYMKENGWKWENKYPAKEDILDTINNLRRLDPKNGELFVGGFIVTIDCFLFVKAIKKGNFVEVSNWRDLEVLLEFNEYVASKD